MISKNDTVSKYLPSQGPYFVHLSISHFVHRV